MKFAVGFRELTLGLPPVTIYRVGGRFKKKGTYVYLWVIHVDVWQKLNQYCKTIIFQLKINVFLKNDQPRLDA